MARINHVALKVTDLETATRFYENVFGFRQVSTGRSRGHISRHLTDGYIDLALMVYDSEEDAKPNWWARALRSTISASKSTTAASSSRKSRPMAGPFSQSPIQAR